jgi:hypothetical protein
MSNQIVSDVSTMVRHGKFRINKTNKNLDRPRFVREACAFTSCVSVGALDGGGNGGKGMAFASKDDRRELWGRK